MKKLLLTASAAALMTTPAFAGALIFEPEPEPVVEVAPAPAPLPVVDWSGPYVGLQGGWAMADADDDDDDWFVGAHAGYDHDFGGFILGGELAYDWLDMNAGDTELDHLVRATLKGGYAFTDQTMGYVKAGAAWLDGENAAGSSTDEFGWVAGAGVEHRFTDSMSAGLEYLWHDVDDFDNAEIQTVGARLSFRF